VVVQSGPYYGYGNYIVIRHAYGFSTCYSHQSKNFVKAGQKVKAGQVIGLTGQTGRATTPHLHFEIRFCGRPINPSIFFDHANHTLKARVLTVQKGRSIK
ncbi:MAG: M23 family metallopeptidase, partial [Prevotella sp.]